MVAKKKVDADEVETNGRDYGYRLSITIEPSARRNMRIAAALNDKSVGEWAAMILERAADKAMENVSS
jgi:hypothetical protein